MTFATFTKGHYKGQHFEFDIGPLILEVHDCGYLAHTKWQIDKAHVDLKKDRLTTEHGYTKLITGFPIQIEQKILYYNSNFTNFLLSDWLSGRLYTSIKAMRKDTLFSP